jgi:prepilin-type N-terminal cleavage/methylation domain-containing protein
MHYSWMPARRLHRQCGFSLIEVIMASSILLVGFVGLIQAVTISSQSLDTARKQQVASQIIAAEIEQLRSGAWSTVASLPATATVRIDSAGVASGDATSFFLTNYTASTTDDNAELCTLAKGFTCSFARTFLRPAAATASTATFVKIAYTITWTTNTGRVQRQQIDAYLGKNGLHLSYQQS